MKERKIEKLNREEQKWREKESTQPSLSSRSRNRGIKEASKRIGKIQKSASSILIESLVFFDMSQQLVSL